MDDGSTDGTTELLDQYKDSPLVVVHHSIVNLGKGAALRIGIAKSTGDILLVQDGDLEYDPRDYLKILTPLTSGSAHVVYGSRFLKNFRGMKKRNWLANKILTTAANVLYGAGITDEATAYKAFSREVADAVQLKCVRFEFCPEFTAKVRRLGYPIVEVPISYNPRGILEGKKIRWQDGVEALWTLIKYRSGSAKTFDRRAVDRCSAALRLLSAQFLSTADPACFVFLTRTAQRQGICRDVLRDHAACGHVAIRADLDRRDQSRIAADEDMLPDVGFVFVHAVVITGNGSRPDVGAVADGGIAQVSQVLALRFRSQFRFFEFDEIANARVCTDVRVHADSGERTDDGPGFDARIGDEAVRRDGDTGGEVRVFENGTRADHAVFANRGGSQEADMRFDQSVHADGDQWIDRDCFRAFERHSGQHQFVILAGAQNAIGVGEFGASVDAEQFAGVVKLQGFDGVAVAGEDLGHIGQIILAGQRIRLDPIHVLPK